MRYMDGSRFSQSLNLRLAVQDDHSVKAVVVLETAQEGPPGYVHGGISASLLDEAMGMAVWASGKQVVAVNLNCTYKRPVPLNTPVTVTGRVERVEGRKAFTIGEIVLADGTVAVEGRGVFVDAPSSIIENTFSFDQLKPAED